MHEQILLYAMHACFYEHVRLGLHGRQQIWGEVVSFVSFFRSLSENVGQWKIFKKAA